jgi:hypothetical protein
MIQRQQSLWLLLSTISAVLSYVLPFYTGQLKDGKYFKLDAANDFPLLIITGISIALSLITIFLFKDRKLQLRLSLGGFVLSLFILIIYFTQLNKFEAGSISLSCLFVFAIIAGYAMAARGIWKDEKLVKSLNRLR